MLDFNLAYLYQVDTKRINEAVKRNTEKFPERFSFILTDEESSFLVANCDQKKKHVEEDIKIQEYLQNKV